MTKFLNKRCKYISLKKNKEKLINQGTAAAISISPVDP